MRLRKYIFPIIIFLILLLAGFLRIWQLDQVPFSIWNDEASLGLNALNVLETDTYKIFYPETPISNGLHINTLAVSFKIFGTNTFALRLPNALFGFLTILGFYLLLKNTKLSKLTTTLGTFALATSFYYLNLSRTALEVIVLPLLLVWPFYFFIKGFNLTKTNHTKINLLLPLSNPLVNFFIAGLLLGLSLYIPTMFITSTLIIILLLITLSVIYKKFITNYWRSIILFIIGIIISAGPLFLYLGKNNSLLTKFTNIPTTFNTVKVITADSLNKNLFLYLQSFFITGDSNQLHNHLSLPLLPAVWALFFIIGFFISLKEILNTFIQRVKKLPPTKLFIPSLLSQLIFWAMLSPGVIDQDGAPNFLKIAGTIPAIFIITVLPFEYLIRLYLHLKTSSFYSAKVWRWKTMQIAFFVLIGTFFLTGFLQTHLYFELWLKNPKTTLAFQQDIFQFGKLIKEQPLKQQNYLLLNKNIPIDTNNHSNIPAKTLIFAALPKIKKYQAYNIGKDIDNLIKENTIDCSNSQFILQPNNPTLALKKIKNYCRNLELHELSLDTADSIPTKVWILK